MNLRSRESTIMQLENNKQRTQPRLFEHKLQFYPIWCGALMLVKPHHVHNIQQVNKIFSETVAPTLHPIMWYK